MKTKTAPKSAVFFCVPFSLTVLGEKRIFSCAGRRVARAEEAPSRDALRGILRAVLSAHLTAPCPRQVTAIHLRSTGRGVAEFAC